MPFCYLVIAAFAVLIFFYGCLELNYFLRISFAWIQAKFCKKRAHILGETCVRSICLTTDIDTYKWHMNNARIVRELDFARADFYQRTGLYGLVTQKNGALIMNACTMRYRKFIKLFTVFTIKSRVVYWDTQTIFIEHQFVTKGFVNAIAISRVRVLGCEAEDVMHQLLTKCKEANPEDVAEKPEIPLEVARWLESNELSSAKLRNSTQSI